MGAVRVVWINGCFGAGKTATAEALVRLRPAHLLVDPELVGFLLWEFDASLRAQDFRELALWRRLVVETIDALRERGRPMVVPMCLHTPDHLSVLTELRARGVTVDHVVLRVEEAELRRRIARQVTDADAATDAGSREFRLAQLPAGLTLTADPPADARVVDTAGLTPDEVAALLV
jgi:predicted ABC-type ATPase